MVSHLSVRGCLNASFTAPGPGSVIRALHCIVHRVPRIVRAGICLYLIWSDMIWLCDITEMAARMAFDLILSVHRVPYYEGRVLLPRPLLKGRDLSVSIWDLISDMYVCICYDSGCMIWDSDLDKDLSVIFLHVWSGLWFCLSYFWVLVLSEGLSVTPLYTRFALCFCQLHYVPLVRIETPSATFPKSDILWFCPYTL